jgi:hypothetical protein
MGTLVSLYPGAAAGLALLLLRFVLAAGLMLLTFQAGVPVPDWAAAVAGMIALGLVFGIWNSILVAANALVALAALVELGNMVSLFWALLGVMSISLALLGPGAYSIDARLYGRRVILSDD